MPVTSQEAKARKRARAQERHKERMASDEAYAEKFRAAERSRRRRLRQKRQGERPPVFCHWCAEEIPGARPGQRFCSASHRASSHNAGGRSRPPLNPLLRTVSKAQALDVPVLEGVDHSVLLSCPECSKTFLASSKAARFCSPQCSRRFHRQKWHSSPAGRASHKNRNHRRRTKVKEGSATAADLRKAMALFDGRCVYCLDTGEELEHIEPLGPGGLHELGNMAPSCRPCNASKSDRDLEEWLTTRPELDHLAVMARIEEVRSLSRTMGEGRARR